jgi:ABC-type Zn2+ transport system substrate-binding protein/surface adhesin
MRRLASSLAAAIALCMFVGCKPGGSNNTTGGNTPVHQDDGDDHGHTHDGDDSHDHSSDDAAGHSHGQPSDLGTARTGEYEMHATQFGDVAAGGESSIEIHLMTLPEGVRALDVTMRIWIGTEAGAESLKSMAAYDADHELFHAHVDAPSPLPSESKWWVEVDAAGQVLRGSFALPK